nr:hypothetical protein [Rhizobium rhizogenes]
MNFITRGWNELRGARLLYFIISSLTSMVAPKRIKSPDLKLPITLDVLSVGGKFAFPA